MSQYDLEMKLPEGKTCGDCRHFRSCYMLFGCKASNTSCDWHPSKFQLAFVQPETTETEA